MIATAASQGNTIMASFTTTPGLSSQVAAKALQAEVTIVMAGSSPVVPVESSPGPGSVLPAPRSQPSAMRGEPGAPAPKPAEQPVFPPLATQAANFFQAAVAFVGDGCALVDDAEYRQRLDVCRACDRRAGDRCTACGCWIKVKARGRAFTCPLDRWQSRC